MTSPSPVAAAAGKLHDLGIQQHAVDEQTCVLALTGEIDLASAPALKAALTELCGHGYAQFVLDMSGVSHMDSTGLGVLVGFQNRLEGRGHLSLAAVPSNLARLIAMLGLDTRIPSFPTVEAGLAESRIASQGSGAGRGEVRPPSPVGLEVPPTPTQPAAAAAPAAPASAARVSQGLPIDADAGLVLGLVSTALPFAGSELAQAELWLKVLRRFGDAARVLRESGIHEAAPDDIVAHEAPAREGAASLRPGDRIADVMGQAQALASQWGLETVGTLEVLRAVIAAYGSAFDRALSAHGGDRHTLDAYLRAL